MSVGLQSLSIPSSEGLFRAILMESNPFGIPYKRLDQATPLGDTFALELDCQANDLACLRAASVDDILTAQASTALQAESLLGDKLAGFLVFAPTVDGSFVIEDPIVAVEQGRLDLPMLVGTNHDEGTIFIAEVADLFGGTVSQAVYEMVLALLFGAETTAEIVAIYPPDPSGNNFNQLSRVANDYLFGCATRFVASQSRSSAWLYEFNETSINIWQGQVPQCAGEACHGDEVPFVFHADRQIGITFTPEQAALSDEMVGYWASFARRLDPNASGFFAWPEFDPAGLQYLIFDTPDLSTAVNPIANCDFWDTVGYDTNVLFQSIAEAAARRSR
jgi:carboxylesterase type B